MGIVLEGGSFAFDRINDILEGFQDIIKSLTILPAQEGRIVSLVIQASTDELGALTGKLGMVSGVKVKSILM